VLLVGLELGAAEYFMSTVQSVASDDDSSKASVAELKSEIEKLRREVREGGTIYPTASPSNYGNGPQPMPPVCAPDDSVPCANWTRSSSPVPASCAPAPEPAHCAPACAPPACAGPFASYNGVPSPSPVQAAAHVTPSAAAQPPGANTGGLVPVPAAAPVNAPRAELTPLAAPQPAPRPDAPAEPAEMPESAPVIGQPR
jgi:hypothetical protein